jgi:hypothetical protein
MYMHLCPVIWTNVTSGVVSDDVSASPEVQDGQQQAGAHAGLNAQQQTAAHASQQVNTAVHAGCIIRCLLVELLKCTRLRDDSKQSRSCSSWCQNVAAFLPQALQHSYMHAMLYD